jgi:hypothetical protein
MRVICKHPNASTEINGVAFTQTDGGMVSADIDEETGAHFLKVPGFSRVAEPVKPIQPEQPEPVKRPRGKP